MIMLYSWLNNLVNRLNTTSIPNILNILTSFFRCGEEVMESYTILATNSIA
jgi:hypothetical protein